ncbi:MAG: hypothetical protein ACOYOA_06795 [Saprospiraceae bacterium]
MKPIFFLLLFCTSISMSKVSAQPRRYVARTFYLDLITFQHAAGIGIYGSKDASNWGLNYSPRANFVMMADNSISFGSHIAFGLSSKGSKNYKLMYDLPLVFEYNFGHMAQPDNSQTFGGFFGTGYGFTALQGEAGTVRSNGLVFNSGLRVLIADRSFGVRASYMQPLKSSLASVYTIGVQHNF